MIRIGNDIIITNDSLCYALKRDRHRTKKRGDSEEQSVTVLGYYGTLDRALAAIFIHEQKRALAEYDGDLIGAIEVIRKLYDDLEKEIRAAIPEANIAIE